MAAYHAKKRLGQNFIISPQVIERIIEAITPSPNDRIIEIGPGRGALTKPLASSGASIKAIEYDRDLIAGLKRSLADHDNVELINQDFLRFEPSWKKFTLVGNLPYNITSPVIDWTVRHHSEIMSAFFMVQKEVAQRLAALPGSKAWSPIGLFTQLFFEVTLLFDIPPRHFRPAPKVTSSFIRLAPIKAMEIEEFEKFERVVRTSFQKRRKTLINNLVPNVVSTASLAKTLLDTAGLPATSRAEELSTKQFLELTNLLISHKLI